MKEIWPNGNWGVQMVDIWVLTVLSFTFFCSFENVHNKRCVLKISTDISVGSNRRGLPESTL